MIRLVFLMRRKPELSLEEFQRYWRDRHAPLVASFATRLKLLRYVQVHTLADVQLEGPRGEMEPPYDGVAELWWQNEESVGDDAEAMRALLEDEREFIDLPQSPLWFSYEYPQVNPSPENIVAHERNSIVKLYYPLRPPAHLKVDDAQLYWRTQHGPLVRSHAEASGLLRYMQVHRFDSRLEARLREARGTVVEPYMGHAEAWFDREVLRDGGPEAETALRAAVEDEVKFIDFRRSCIWLGKEHVIVSRL